MAQEGGVMEELWTRHNRGCFEAAKGSRDGFAIDTGKGWDGPERGKQKNIFDGWSQDAHRRNKFFA